MKKVLFVCTGNTCRSPMAAGIFNQIAEKRGLNYQAFSRGVAVFSQTPASANAIKTTANMGVNIEKHLSQNISEDDISEADLILGLTDAHAIRLRAEFPNYEDKIFAVPGGNVDDPFGSSLDIYEESARQIALSVEMILDILERREREHKEESSDGDKNSPDGP